MYKILEFIFFITMNVLNVCSANFSVFSANNNITLFSNSDAMCIGRQSNISVSKIVLSTQKSGSPYIFDVWQRFPLDIFENTQISPQCSKAYNNYLRMLEKNNLEALKMFDASAKPPAGILKGNINQYGHFDECLEVENAQYCLTEIDLEPLWKKGHKQFKNLAHSHYNMKETFDDPGHRVPGFSFIRWGFCIPTECSQKDLTNALHQKFGVRSQVRENMCQISQRRMEKLGFGDYFARTYFVFLVGFVCIGTYFCQKLEKIPLKNRSILIKISLCFSLQQNWNKLTKITENNGKEYKSLHGVRALSALALFMAHKTMALLYNPYINKTWMAEVQSMKWSVLGRNAIIYTDCFLLISGLLNANALFSDLEKKNRLRFREKVVNRLFRILPSLVTVILFCTYLLPSMGSGPLWPLVINYHSNLCKKYMWRNMLLVHNYFGFENMCLTHTHQVGIDMQLFLVTPLFVYSIWRLKSKGFFLIIFIALASTILRFWATIQYNLSHFVHFGIPVSRMFDTANYSYILPTHRATIYLMGVVLAYVLKYTSKHPQISKLQTILIWTVLYIVSLSTWFGPMTMSVRSYQYNSFHSALYGAFSPISWGMGVAWVIYATERGYGSWFTYLLNWKYFEVFTRIAYAVYLVQFPVFFYNVGITRHAGEFKNYMMLPPTETGIILFLSTVLTLFVEMPFQNINKIVFSKNEKLN